MFSLYDSADWNETNWLSDIVQTRVQPLYLQSELWLIPAEILGFVMQMEQKIKADFTLALLSGAQ